MSCSDMNVTLVSSDGVTFSVPIKVASLSIFVSMMTTNDCDIDTDDCEIESIPILRVNGKTLRIIIEYMHYYSTGPMVTIEKPLVSNYIGDVVQNWYAIFIERVKQENMLYDIVNASNYMYIQPLLELSCAEIALTIRQKSRDEIRDEFYLTT